MQGDRVPQFAGRAHQTALRERADEDSNLHPVIPDQALNLVTRVSDPSYASIASIASRSSTNLDDLDDTDVLDVAADVATAGLSGGPQSPPGRVDSAA
jgi:hypothetical protein